MSSVLNLRMTDYLQETPSVPFSTSASVQCWIHYKRIPLRGFISSIHLLALSSPQSGVPQNKMKSYAQFRLPVGDHTYHIEGEDGEALMTEKLTLPVEVLTIPGRQSRCPNNQIAKDDNCFSPVPRIHFLSLRHYPL